MSILCVDTNAIETSGVIQRKIDLEDLLNNHIDYFSDIQEAVKNKYVPLNFSVSVRSMYSNLVIQNEGKCCANVIVHDKFIHKGYDLVMYLSSVGLMQFFNYSKKFADIMAQHSQFEPIGLYYDLNDPIIYSQVIMSDVGMKLLEDCLKSGVSIIPIKDIDTTKNIKALTDTLILVRSE